MKAYYVWESGSAKCDFYKEPPLIKDEAGRMGHGTAFSNSRLL